MPLPPLVEPIAALSDEERTRTARHARLHRLGEIGQRRIAAAHVAVVGAGGLGSPVVLALAAAGVGTLTIIDDDVVDLSNLQRQVMHRLSDVGAPKTDSAVRVAGELSATRVLPVRERLTPDNGARLLAGADLVVDGSDEFSSREAVASACESLGVPLVWGTVQEFAGQVTVFWSRPPEPGVATRLSDLYAPGSEAPACSAVGVFGPLCLQVGALMAGEALKLVAGVGEPLLGRVLLIDAPASTQREIALRPARAAAAAARPATTDAPVDTVPEVDEPDDRAVLDVRAADEVAVAAFPGALHVPLAAVLAEPTAIEGPVVVVCQVGARARVAARALRAAGVEAWVLAGGMDAWTRRHAASAPAGAAS